jgi:predicted nucleotidyltransferase component of viral defense system
LVSEIYENQVDLLLEVLPILAGHSEFAIKGGTALNLFYLDLPRLSVDIDLCYLPIKDRTESFFDIHRILGQMKDQIGRTLGFNVQANHPLDGKREARLVVSKESVVIKIEPNYILRGSLFDPRTMEISEVVQARFEKSATALLLDHSDLYGGKFCAALDRQHPRDLFDVHHYFKKNTITTPVKDAFIFYLLSHNRPMHELLDAQSEGSCFRSHASPKEVKSRTINDVRRP